MMPAFSLLSILKLYGVMSHLLPKKTLFMNIIRHKTEKATHALQSMVGAFEISGQLQWV